MAQFQPGQSGNPAGKLKGTRNALTEQFFKDLLADYRRHGKQTIERARRIDPVAFLKIVAAIALQTKEAERDRANQDAFLDALKVISDKRVTEQDVPSPDVAGTARAAAAVAVPIVRSPDNCGLPSPDTAPRPIRVTVAGPDDAKVLMFRGTAKSAPAVPVKAAI